MLTIIVSGRNDDYGKDFRERLFRTALHNSALLQSQSAGVEFEYLLAEWNPLPDRPLLAEEFVSRVPNARAVVVPPAIHQKYSLNPRMPFHEMAAKNAVLYRAHRIDVAPELDWNQIRNPANQLPSGEGFFPPPYYLGAGGDFCLASRRLWHALRGFNEQIRFSTRAKDWQFFLSASAEGARIEFIGDVYHLDHEGGFRNTASQDLSSPGVHFGQWWDIEFGLPVMNAEHWGLYGLRERQEAQGRILLLEGDDYTVSADQDALDETMMPLLTRSACAPDTDAAFLLHAVCAAHRNNRRLICRIKDTRIAATLSGFATIASSFSVDVRCNWLWPAMPGFTVSRFTPEPEILLADDWIVEQSGSGIRIYENESGSRPGVLPEEVPVEAPEFNPLLANRLLFAYLNLQRCGWGTMAIYGGGSHTRNLLRWGIPDGIELIAIAETTPAQNAIGRWPIVSVRDLPSLTVDAVLLSSASFESDMAERARDLGLANVIALYGDWPAHMWKRRAKEGVVEVSL
jgi:hypothetical protein